MTDDKTASTGPTAELDQRRRYPPPTIDLAATEVASADDAASKQSEIPRSTFASDHDQERANPDDHATSEDGANDDSRNGSRNKPPRRGWKLPRWPLDPPGSLIAAGVGGGLIMLFILLGLRWLGFPSREHDLSIMSDRLTRIETQLDHISARAGDAGDSRLVNRMTSVESALKALESDNINLNARMNEASDAARNAGTRAEAAAKTAEQASNNPRGSITQSDLDVLSSRLDALEKTTKAIQAELAKITNGTGDQAARVALLATSLRLAVERGNGFAAELDDLKSLIKDPRELAPLAPFAASGVPTPAVLQRDLSALTPALIKAANVQTSEGGFLQRLQANAEHLVRVRPVDETSGDEPENVVLRIELKSARGDIPGALAEFAKLPPTARAPAEDWIKKAQSREAAIALARKISTDALGALAIR
jgi:hypothetical protein